MCQVKQRVHTCEVIQGEKRLAQLLDCLVNFDLRVMCLLCLDEYKIQCVSDLNSQEENEWPIYSFDETEWVSPMLGQLELDHLRVNLSFWCLFKKNENLLF